MSRSLDDAERKQLRLKARVTTLAALHALGGEARRDQIAEWALANGGFTVRELAAPAPEAAIDKFDRAVDHQLSWALTNLKRDGLVENPRRATWRLAGATLEPVSPASDEQASGDRLAELRAMPYAHYLHTPEWRKARAAALLRAGDRCSLDVTHSDDLEVHHRTYERLGAELATDLVVLCRACHRLHHKRYGRPRRAPVAKPRATSQPRRPPAPSPRSAPPPRSLADTVRRPSLLRRLLAR